MLSVDVNDALTTALPTSVDSEGRPFSSGFTGRTHSGSQNWHDQTVVTYAGQHVVILLFQPQGRSDTVLAASPWQDRPPGTLSQHQYAAVI